MKKNIIIAFVVLAVAVLIQDFLKVKNRNTASPADKYVIMLSLDGFRWDYNSLTETPNLDYIKENGVKATGLQPTFPSKTFPNHYTIATGLFPGNHGLISNRFYAPDIDKTYSIRDRSSVENGKFYKGEPIWVTAESQKVKSASFYWVGSEAKIKGYRPSYYKLYDHDFPYSQRIDTVIHWLKLPHPQRPHLITWYLDEADGIGHKYGPDSPELVTTIEKLDSLVGVFIKKLNDLPIKDSVNFIIVSDHGMAKTEDDKTIYLNKHVKKDWIKYNFGDNPFTLIYPKKNCKDSVYNALEKLNGINVYKKEEIPERFNFKQNERVSEIVVVADSGFTTSFSNKHKDYSGGTHGYDNTFKDMYGIFYAYGPDFKKNYNAGTLYNTDIYELLVNLLNIKPAPNDGKPEQIFHVLKKSSKNIP